MQKSTWTGIRNSKDNMELAYDSKQGSLQQQAGPHPKGEHAARELLAVGNRRDVCPDRFRDGLDLGADRGAREVLAEDVALVRAVDSQLVDHVDA